MWNTIISDNFNRANGSVGNGWAETTANTWTINNNKLTTVGTAGSVLYRNTNKIEHRVVLETSNLNGLAIVTLRYNSTTKNGYYAVLQKATNFNVIIGRWSNNGATGNTIISDTLVTTETALKIEFFAVSNNPTTLYLAISDLNNNILKTLTATDFTTELQTQTNVGINYVSNDTNVGIFDNLVVSEFIGNSIKPDNTKLVLSPYNWNITNNIATTINAGSYFKCKFTGTYLELRTDITNYLNNSSTDYPRLKYFIDNTITNEISINNSRIVIEGLTDSEHEFIGYINRTSYSLDRWNTPLSTFVIRELIVADDKEFKDITKYSSNILILGDSITEGLAINTNVDDFSSSYSYYLINGLEAEIGVIAYGSSGYTNNGAANVPKASTNIDYYYSTISRLVNNKFNPIPNTIFINLGTNDAISSINSNTLKTDIKLLINKLINYSNKYTKIFVCIPFGGYSKTVITETVNELNNKQVELIDLNEYIGLNNTGASYKSTDGIHPNLKYSAYLGNKLSSKLTNLSNKDKLLELFNKEQINLKFTDLVNTKVIRDYLNYLTNN